MPLSFEVFRFDASGEVLVIGPRAAFGRLAPHAVDHADRARLWLLRAHAQPDAIARLRASSGAWWHGDTHNRLSDSDIIERVLADIERGRLAAFVLPYADALYVSTPDPSRVASALADSPVPGEAVFPGRAPVRPGALPRIGAPEPFRAPQMVRPQAPAGPVRAKNVRGMGREERFYLLLKNAADSPRLSDEGRRYLERLMSGPELHASIGALATWAAALRLGVEYLLDAALAREALLGPLEDAAEGIVRLREMLERVEAAESEGDLDAAAELFADALMLLGGARLRQVLMEARRRALPIDKERERPRSRSAGKASDKAPVQRLRPLPEMLAIVPTPPDERCDDLGSKLDEIDRAQRRASLASDVYDRYDPHLSEEVAAKVASPAGFKRVSDDLTAMKEILARDDLTEGDLRNLLAPPGSSYRAALYQDDSGKTFVVFRGTENKEGSKDWIENGLQGLGQQSQHYEEAKRLVHILRQSLGSENIEVVGHSKGGGMAAAAAMSEDVPATIFNAAGVHRNTLDGVDPSTLDDKIQSYVVEGEVLNWVQDNRSVVQGLLVAAAASFAGILGGIGAALGLSDALPKSNGTRTKLPPVWNAHEGPRWFDPVGYRVKLHGMDKVTQGLQALADKLLAQYAGLGCPARAVTQAAA